MSIINLSEKALAIEDAEIEVEYQTTGTIGKYGLEFNGDAFTLQNKKTACLALTECIIPETIQESLTSLNTIASSCCSPNKSCC